MRSASPPRCARRSSRLPWCGPVPGTQAGSSATHARSGPGRGDRQAPRPGRGLVLLHRRWVVEGSFAWLTKFRRLVRDLETVPATIEAMIWTAATQQLSNRLTRCPKSQTLSERYKVPPAWRPTALRKSSKGSETEKRPGKEKKQVMTADEIIVGIEDSPSGRAALRWAAAYPRSAGAADRAIHVVDQPEAQDMCVYPVVADYVYPDGSGWSVVRQ